MSKGTSTLIAEEWVVAGKAQVRRKYRLPSVGVATTCRGRHTSRAGDKTFFVVFTTKRNVYLCHESLSISPT